MLRWLYSTIILNVKCIFTKDSDTVNIMYIGYRPRGTINLDARHGPAHAITLTDWAMSYLRPQLIVYNKRSLYWQPWWLCVTCIDLGTLANYREYFHTDRISYSILQSLSKVFERRYIFFNHWRLVLRSILGGHSTVKPTSKDSPYKKEVSFNLRSWSWNGSNFAVQYRLKTATILCRINLLMSNLRDCVLLQDAFRLM